MIATDNPGPEFDGPGRARDKNRGFAKLNAVLADPATAFVVEQQFFRPHVGCSCGVKLPLDRKVSGEFFRITGLGFDGLKAD